MKMNGAVYLKVCIVQPFELWGVTSLIRSAVKNWRSGKLYFFWMIKSRERSIKPFSAD
jgi:hypothetical protein